MVTKQEKIAILGNWGTKLLRPEFLGGMVASVSNAIWDIFHINLPTWGVYAVIFGGATLLTFIIIKIVKKIKNRR